MKRSEMLKALTGALHLYPVEAEAILDLIEKLGMLPPIEPGSLDLSVPKWEPEEPKIEKEIAKAIRNREHR